MTFKPVKRLWIILVVAVVVLGTLLAACAPAAAPTPTPAPKAVAGAPSPAPAAPTAAPKPPAATPTPAGPIKIGWLSHTGSPVYAAFYTLMQKSIKMAVDEINAKGGVLGRSIEVIEADDQAKPDQTVINAEKLITQDKVVALIGPAALPNQLAAAAVADKYQTPQIMEIGASDEVTQKGWKYLFRPAANTTQIVSAAIEFLKGLDPKPKSVAYLHENRSFGLVMAPLVQKLAADAGIQVVATEPYDSAALDFKPILLRVKGFNPDAVLTASYVPDSVLLVKQSKEVGLSPRIWLGLAAGYVTEDFLKGAGPAAEGVYVEHSWLPSKDYSGSVEFAQKFIKEVGKVPDHQPGIVYGVIYMLADAIKRAGSTDGAKLREALAQTDLTGPAGPVKFDAQGNNTRKEQIISQVKGGKWVVLWPAKYAGTTYP